nr:DciA family protein [Roseibium hamelinense]
MAELIGRAVDPVCQKRGFASLDLLKAWPDIVGERYADRVRPERLLWPRKPVEAEASGEVFAEPATLLVHTDGATALLLSHEMPQVIERINTFYGWAAVGRIKIIQKAAPPRPKSRAKTLPPLTADEEARIKARVAGVENDRLRQALEKLGKQVVARQRKGTAG